MTYSFDDGDAPERHDLQYFEMFVNRGIYHQGWTAVTRHSIPWRMDLPMPPLDEDVWELYAPDDWTQAHDLAAEQPEKLAELQRLFIIEATKYNVLPLDDRRAERFNADIAGRPQLIKGSTQLLFGGMGRLSENSVLVLKNKSHSDHRQRDGARRWRAGCDHRPGRRVRRLEPVRARGQAPLRVQLLRVAAVRDRGHEPTSRRSTIRCAWSSRTTAAAWRRAATSRSTSTAQAAGDGRVEVTVPMVFSADETTDVGKDTGTPVSPDYGATGNEFNGRVHWVQIDIDEKAEDLDHLITPEERMHIAMARQ